MPKRFRRRQGTVTVAPTGFSRAGAQTEDSLNGKGPTSTGGSGSDVLYEDLTTARASAAALLGSQGNSSYAPSNGVYEDSMTLNPLYDSKRLMGPADGSDTPIRVTLPTSSDTDGGPQPDQAETRMSWGPLYESAAGSSHATAPWSAEYDHNADRAGTGTGAPPNAVEYTAPQGDSAGTIYAGFEDGEYVETNGAERERRKSGGSDPESDPGSDPGFSDARWLCFPTLDNFEEKYRGINEDRLLALAYDMQQTLGEANKNELKALLNKARGHKPSDLKPQKLSKSEAEQIVELLREAGFSAELTTEAVESPHKHNTVLLNNGYKDVPGADTVDRSSLRAPAFVLAEGEEDEGVDAGDGDEAIYDKAGESTAADDDAIYDNQADANAVGEIYDINSVVTADADAVYDNKPAVDADAGEALYDNKPAVAGEAFYDNKPAVDADETFYDNPNAATVERERSNTGSTEGDLNNLADETAGGPDEYLDIEPTDDADTGKSAVNTSIESESQGYKMSFRRASGISDEHWRVVDALLRLLTTDIPKPQNIFQQHPVITALAAFLGLAATAAGVVTVMGGSGSGSGSDNEIGASCLPPSPLNASDAECEVALSTASEVGALVDRATGVVTFLVGQFGLVLANLATKLNVTGDAPARLAGLQQNCDADAAQRLCLDGFPVGLTNASVPDLSDYVPPQIINDFCTPVQTFEGMSANVSSLLQGVEVDNGAVSSLTLSNLTSTGLSIRLDGQLVSGGDVNSVTLTAPFDRYTIAAAPDAYGARAYSLQYEVTGPGGTVQSQQHDCQINFEAVADPVSLDSANLVCDEDGTCPLKFVITENGGDPYDEVELSGVNGTIHKADGTLIGGHGVVRIAKADLDGSYFKPDANVFGPQTWTRRVVSRAPNGDSIAAVDSVPVEVLNFVDAPEVVNQTVMGDENTLIPINLTFDVAQEADHVTGVLIRNVTHGDFIVDGVNVGRGDVYIADADKQNVSFAPDTDYHTQVGKPLRFAKDVITADDRGHTAVGHGFVDVNVRNVVNKPDVIEVVKVGFEDQQMVINVTEGITVADGDKISEITYSNVTNGDFYARNGSTITFLGRGKVTINETLLDQEIFYQPDADNFGAYRFDREVTTVAIGRESEAKKTAASSIEVILHNVVDPASDRNSSYRIGEDSYGIYKETEMPQTGDVISRVRFSNLTGFRLILNNGTSKYPVDGVIELSEAEYKLGVDSIRPLDPDYFGKTVWRKEVFTRPASAADEAAAAAAGLPTEAVVETYMYINVYNRADPPYLSVGPSQVLQGSESNLLNVTAVMREGDSLAGAQFDGFEGTITVNGKEYGPGEFIEFEYFEGIKELPPVYYNSPNSSYFGTQNIRVTVAAATNEASGGGAFIVSTSATDTLTLTVQNVVNPADIFVGEVTTLIESGNATDIDVIVKPVSGDHFVSMQLTDLPQGKLFVGDTEYTLAQAAAGINLSGTDFPQLRFQPSEYVHGNFTPKLSVITADDYGRFDEATADLPVSITPVAGGVEYHTDSNSKVGFSGKDHWVEFNVSATPLHAYERVFEYKIEGVNVTNTRVQEYVSSGWQDISFDSSGVATAASGNVRFSSEIIQSFTSEITACTESTEVSGQETCKHSPVALSMSFFAPPPPPPTTTPGPTTTTKYCGVDCSLFSCEEARQLRLCECEKPNPRNTLRHRPETNAIDGCGFAPNCIASDYAQFSGCS